jgi:hypothetical protein
VRLGVLLLPIAASLAVHPDPVAAQDKGGLAAPNDSTTRVTVSRREVRVTFPRDTAGRWGWSDRQDPANPPQYWWAVMIDGMDGHRPLELRVLPTSPGARTFTSLDSLVSAGRASLCDGGLIGRCDATGVSAAVADGRVVVTLRDSASIARLFGLRPATVRVAQSRPDEPYRYDPPRVPVEYVDPQIPAPNAATLVDAAKSRRIYETSISIIQRGITGGVQLADTVWIPLGDSARLYIDEARCHRDLCSGVQFDSPVTWTIGDTSIVQARVVDRGLAPTDFAHARMIVLAGRQVGRTMVRADLPPSASDTMPSQEPPQRMLVRGVNVVRPVERVELTAPSDTIRAGSRVELRARAFDRSGRVVSGLPMRLLYTAQRSVMAVASDKSFSYVWSSPGLETIIASFGDKADTLTVRIAPRR